MSTTDPCSAQGLSSLLGQPGAQKPGAPHAAVSTQCQLQDLQGLAWCRGLNTALVHPVVTPRFVPSCTPALLQGLGAIAQRSACHVQSHISESLDNDAFVAQLHPEVTLECHTHV